MKTGSIHQHITFNASPEKVYSLIMDANHHSNITDSDVEMSTDINGTFLVFDGYCTGYNIELVPGKIIVQAWKFQEDGWPEDHYSQCTFLFDDAPEGCILEFTQTDIPEHKVEALTKGWMDFYWEPMKIYLEDL